MEIENNNQTEGQDIANETEEFVRNVLEIIPNTDKAYVRARARELVGDDAATERFILELLNDPTPPPNWKQIYLHPENPVAGGSTEVQIPRNEQFLVGPSIPAPSWRNHLFPSSTSIPAPEVHEFEDLGGPSIPAPEVHELEDLGGPSIPAPEIHEFEDLGGSNIPAPEVHEFEDLGGPSIPAPSWRNHLFPSSPSIPAPEVHELEDLAGPSIPAPEIHEFEDLGGPSIPAPDVHEFEDLGGPNIPAPEVLEFEDVDPEAIWKSNKEAYLCDIFPNYSPEWLVEQIESFFVVHGTDDVRFSEKVTQMMEMDKRNIPSKREWQKQVKAREELEKWGENMTVNDMLELYDGDPAKHFDDPMRKSLVDELYRRHAEVGLMDAFRYANKAVVVRELKRAKYSYALALEMMPKIPNTRRTARLNEDVKYPARHCIEFVKEKKFIELRKSIEVEKIKRAVEKRNAIEAARMTNSLVECECCYSECLDEDMVPCNAGHVYCKQCIRQSVDVAMGEGQTVISCLGQCGEEINSRELQAALLPNVLSRLLTKRQADEVGAAEIENLVLCPFCPYSTIMENQEDKVVACRNPDCGRESCRLCKKPNHVPLRCEEVPKKDDIRKRIEEALSDALIRKCANPKCPASFVKTEGCNRMVCPKCKAMQCYICKEIVPGYEHFYGQGGEKTEERKCPLFQDNVKLHEQEVLNAAQREEDELKEVGVEIEYNQKAGVKFLDSDK